MGLTISHIISAVVFSNKNIASMSGWIGTISYVLAYILLSINKIRSDQALYHLLNIIGSAGLVYYALYINSTPNLLVNIIWGVIGIIATIHIIWKRNN